MGDSHTSKSVWRRKLLTLSGLAAIVGLARGADRAEAAHDTSTAYDPANVLHLGVINDGNGLTNSLAETALAQATSLVANTIASAPALQVINIGPAAEGIVAFGGTGTSGVGGTGLEATGGNSTSNQGGWGAEATGGSSSTSIGGKGLHASGGPSTSGTGGLGLDARGGQSTSGDGGVAINAAGGLTTGAGRAGGNGIFARGGPARAGGGAVAGHGIFAVGGIIDTDSNSSADPGTTGGIGLLAHGAGDSGFESSGVFGQNHSTANAAVHGENRGTGPGVRGESGQFGTGSGIGIHGLSGSGRGVRGENNSASNGAAEGVNSGTGPGVRGLSGANGTGSGVGVHGQSGSGRGVLGQSTSGNAVEGNSQSAFGIVGTSTNGAGLSGLSANGEGILALTQAANRYGLVVFTPQDTTPGAYIKGTLVVTGPKSSAVPTSKGLTLLYAVEAPEALFEDVGRARLVNGRARVALDPVFAQTIETDEYEVFPVPRGECRGLFIASTDARGFEVRELSGGTSGVEFGYRVVGKRKDMKDGHRLATVEVPDPSKLKLPVPTAPERSRPDLAPSVEPSAPTPRRTPGR